MLTAYFHQMLLFQALYDELLRGSAEIYGSAFASKTKKAIETLSEERKKKVILS